MRSDVALREALKKFAGRRALLGRSRHVQIGFRGLNVDTTIFDVPRQAVVGGDVELPEQIFSPIGQSLRVYRADIGESHQCQGLEAFDRADQVGQLFRRLGIGEITARHHGGKRQVMANQEAHQLAVEFFHADTGHRLVGQLHAALGMVPFGNPFTQIVKQEREVEKLGLVQLRQQAREPSRQVVRCVGQFL